MAVNKHSVAIHNGQFSERCKAVVGPDGPLWIIRYAYYAFIFSLPFENVDIGLSGTSTLSRMMGLMFLAVAPLQPRLCFKWPPQVFWCFAVYLFGYAMMGFFQGPAVQSAITTRLFTLVQLLILFWVSYNLMRYERALKGTLLTLAASCVLLAVLQTAGVAGEEVARGRMTAFEANPNTLANIFALGLLGLAGLAYGRNNKDRTVRFLFWGCSGMLALAIIRTGSRGAIVALIIGLLTFLLKGRSLGSKLKMGAIAVLAITFLGVASYQIETLRVRWEKTFTEGSLAGREEILPKAWDMFVEKPLIGWGPIRNTTELGSRLGLPMRDPHNLYLSLLTEVGIIGALPFFVGLWLCWRAAWKARDSIQGIVPLGMLLFLFTINVKGTWHHRKLFWVVLAYALASSSYVALSQRWRRPSPPAPVRLRTNRSRFDHALYVGPTQNVARYRTLRR